MPQMQLPIFPAGSQQLTNEIAFQCRDNQVTYFYGHLPVFTHPREDVGMFRLITSQWIDQGLITQGEVARNFGISLTTIKRCLKRYRQGGARALFAPAAKRRGNKLTPECLVEVQERLNQGKRVPAISRELGILPSTLHKAIDDGRLKVVKKKKIPR